VRRKALQVAVYALVFALGACASTAHQTCGVGERLSVVDTLYFGGAYPGGVVTVEQWQGFIDSVVTPRFPEGLTVWQAAGQYRTHAGEIQHEPTWVLQLIHADAAPAQVAIHEIRTAYRKQFAQESVLRAHSMGCVSFE
jgi:Protein of unknown function (DUF3574)